MEFYISLAGVPLKINTPRETTKSFCGKYIINRCDDAVDIVVTQDDVEYECGMTGDDKAFSRSYLEVLALYRKIVEALIEYDTILFHSSAVAVDGQAYLFAAPSGTGKSTHARLWREVFGERVVMINDDKPLIRFLGGEAHVFGTPWDGKHKLSNNTSAPIAGICILHRGEKNGIERIKPIDALPKLLSQTYRPENKEKMSRTLSMLINLSDSVPMWSLFCNMEPDAAIISYNTMKGIKK